jgi:hypothetical protein
MPQYRPSPGGVSRLLLLLAGLLLLSLGGCEALLQTQGLLWWACHWLRQTVATLAQWLRFDGRLQGMASSGSHLPDDASRCASCLPASIR